MNPHARDGELVMDEFVSFCSRLDATFPQQIVAASEADLVRLEQLAGLPFPPEYTAFLRRMGRTPAQALGGFLSDLVFGIEAAEQFYRDPPTPVPRDAVYLGTVDDQVEMFLGIQGSWGQTRPVLQFSWPVDPDSGRFTDEDRMATVVADSLAQFLYREAFLRIRRPLLAHHGELRENVRVEKPDPASTEHRRAQFRLIAERLRFKQVPYMDKALVFYDRADAALALFSAEIAEDIVYVDADDERELARLAEVLSDNLDLRGFS